MGIVTLSGGSGKFVPRLIVLALALRYFIESGSELEKSCGRDYANGNISPLTGVLLADILSSNISVLEKLPYEV